MADILLKRDSTLAATYVPNTFIDEYMTHADGEFVKIYLYLLRCMSNPDTMFSISDIADKFDHTEKDVTRALKYWEKMHLLRLEFNTQKELTGICLSDVSEIPARKPQTAACTGQPQTAGSVSAGNQPYDAPPVKAATAGHHATAVSTTPAGQDVTDVRTTIANYPAMAVSTAPAGQDVTNVRTAAADYSTMAVSTATASQDMADARTALAGQDMTAVRTATAEPDVYRQPLPERREYSLNQLAHFCEDETVQEILFVTERYLGHHLNNTEIQMILYWLDRLEFSQDLIEYLIEQSVAKNHLSIRYMDKIALSWAKAGIRTLSDAKQASQLHSSAVHAVQKAFGITNRTLATPEMEYVERWSKDMGFSDEMIALACQKTILKIHQISYEYTDSILKSWQSQNAHTINDIKLLDAQYQEAKSKKITAGKAAARTAKGTMAGGFANFSQRTYNYDELERELLAHSR